MPSPGARGFSRRQALIGGGIGVAGVAALAGGLWRSQDEGEEPTPSVTPTPGNGASPTPTPTPLPSGGLARLAAPATLNFDTFDSARTGEPSVVEVLGRVYSRLLQWADFGAPTLEGDLAARWERPGDDSLVLHLRPEARWQSRPGFVARPVTADDVVAHLQRVVDIANAGQMPALQRPWDWGRILRITSPAAGQVLLETDGPDPFLPHTLAGRFAVIQPHETVEALARPADEVEPVTLAGSGPFQLATIKNDGTLAFRSSLDGHRKAVLDALEVSHPGADAERFLARELDEAITRDRRDAPRIRANAPGSQESARFEDSPVISTVYLGAAPWNHARLLRAISAALNRAELSRRLFGERAQPAGPVAPVFSSFLIPESELASSPGYRTSYTDDAKDARALWEAGGGPALGPVTVDFPAVFDPLYSASSVVIDMLNAALGPQFRAAVEPYTTISRKVAEGRYGGGASALWFGWGPPVSGPDPSQYLIETFHSQGTTARTAGFSSPGLDRLLGRLSVETELDAGRDLAREVQSALLEESFGGVIPWLQQCSEVFRHPSLGRAPLSPFWDQHLDATMFIDPART